MKEANEIAVELQAQFDYFFAAAILATLGFSAQLNVEPTKLTVVLYMAGLASLACSTIFAMYRMQQKPLIYELQGKADDARANKMIETEVSAEKKAKLLELKYERAYMLMYITFVAGSFLIGLTKVIKPLQIAFGCGN